MYRITIYRSLLLFALYFGISSSDALWGQCQTLYFEWGQCIGVQSITAGTPLNGSGHYRYDWTPGGGPRFTLLSGQGTPTATFQMNPSGTTIANYVNVHIYDSIQGCTYIYNYDVWVADYPFAFTGTIPACPNPSTTFTYTHQHGIVFGIIYHPTYTWTAIGGTVLSRNTLLTPSLGFDTVRVQWNGPPPHMLVLSEVYDWSGQGWVAQCTNSDTLFEDGGQAVISGPLGGCGPFTGTYSVNPSAGATYNWTATNGTILSGQGTATVSVSFTSSGSLSVDKTLMPCGTVLTDVTPVSVGNGTVPAPNIGPTATICPGGILDAGPGGSYQWSTGHTTRTIQPTSNGTYAVTVTNSPGCTATSTSNVTISSLPTPNLGANQTVCLGTGVVLNPGTFTSYQWSTGATTQSISPTTSGTYTVTVSNASGCTGSASVTLTFLPLPTPSLPPTQSTCSGTPVTLNPGSFSTYAWSTGATTPTISPTTSGSYSVTVTSASGCTASDVILLTFNPLPTFTLGNDTIICADTTITLSGPVGMSSYAWSTGASSANLSVSTGGNYGLTVTNGNGCTASDAILIQGLTDCVFPGDANYDGVADNQDILSIGAYYGRVNAPRANASTQWYGQSTADWGSPLPGQADPKHSDCDGDGTVAAADTNAVHLNYGQTHSKNAGIATAGAPLRVVAMQDSLAPGGMATFAVTLGDGGFQADSAYGLAFTVNYTGGVTVAPGLAYVDYSNCWFAPAGQRVSFAEPHPGSATVDLAIVRNDQQQQLGYGEVCRFGILTDANLSATSATLTVWLTGVHRVDAELGPQAVEAFADSVVVSQTILGQGNAILASAPSIYPNPANDVVQIVQENARIAEVRVMDATGRMLRHVQHIHATRMTLPTADWAQGIYFLEIRSDRGTYLKRLSINR